MSNPHLPPFSDSIEDKKAKTSASETANSVQGKTDAQEFEDFFKKVSLDLMSKYNPALQSEPSVEHVASYEKSDFHVIKIAGFRPGEKLHISIKCLNEVREIDILMPENIFVMSFSAGVEGFTEGDLLVHVQGEGERRSAYNLFHWFRRS